MSLVCERDFCKWNQGTEHGLTKDIWYEMNVWLWHHYTRRNEWLAYGFLSIKRVGDYFIMQNIVHHIYRKHGIFCERKHKCKVVCKCLTRLEKAEMFSVQKYFAGKELMNKKSYVYMPIRVYIYIYMAMSMYIYKTYMYA